MTPGTETMTVTWVLLKRGTDKNKQNQKKEMKRKTEQTFEGKQNI